MRSFLKIPENNEIYCTAGREYCMVSSDSTLYRCNCHMNYSINKYELKDYKNFLQNYEYMSKNIICKKYECYNRNCDTYHIETWKKSRKIKYNHDIFWRKEYESLDESFTNSNYFVHCEPVKGCPNECPYCAMYLFRDHKVKSVLDVKLFVEFLSYISSIRTGVKFVSFAGAGEPFLHPNIEDLIRESSRLNFYVHITTSALLNIDKIFNIKDLSKVFLNISLHPSSHNWNEEKIIDFIKNLQSINCKFCCTIVQYEENILITEHLRKRVKDVSNEIDFHALEYVDHYNLIKKVFEEMNTKN